MILGSSSSFCPDRQDLNYTLLDFLLRGWIQPGERAGCDFLGWTAHHRVCGVGHSLQHQTHRVVGSWCVSSCSLFLPFLAPTLPPSFLPWFCPVIPRLTAECSHPRRPAIKSENVCSALKWPRGFGGGELPSALLKLLISQWRLLPQWALWVECKFIAVSGTPLSFPLPAGITVEVWWSSGGTWRGQNRAVHADKRLILCLCR